MTYLIRHLPLFALFAAILFPSLPRAQSWELIMVEQRGCHWCAMWDEEIGPIYPLTEAGQTAPLRRIDLRAPLPDDLSLIRPATFTPTFVLVSGGAEIGRIEGYPGEDFFWGLLERLMVDQGALTPLDSGENG